MIMAISRSDISKELTPNLGNDAKRRNSMAKKKKKTGGTVKKQRGGMTRVGLYPQEEKRAGVLPFARRVKKGGPIKKKAGGKIKKYAAGGQGYKAREDESLGMRTGPEASKTQSMAARRDESYGDWGKRRRGRVNVKKGGSIGVALRGGGAVTR
jgi:hypothetical protein